MQAILGAGLSGLSLAHALLAEGVREPLVLVDRRTAFARDRTWCLWDTGTTPLTALADHRWPAWRVVGPGGGAVEHRSPSTPYVHVRADRFYAAALDRLEGRADVRLGERVLDVRDDPGGEGVVVTTSSGALPARRAYDARGWQDEAATWQRFLGLEVEVARPVFDPGVATLMDFRLGDPGEARFAYVLPFSPTRALVEDTSLGGPAVPAAARRAAIAAYLAEHWGAGDVEVVREERGAVPMSPAPPAPVSRLVPVGQRAGATRPSSGYTVVRAQAHAAAVARAAARGTPPPARAGRRRYAALDALFLRALTARPEVFGTLFERLARGVPGPAFARFMNDAARPADLAAVVGALTCPAFLGALAPRGPHARPAGGSARPATA